MMKQRGIKTTSY